MQSYNTDTSLERDTVSMMCTQPYISDDVPSVETTRHVSCGGVPNNSRAAGSGPNRPVLPRRSG